MSGTQSTEIARGAKALEVLAARFPQLYVAPAKDAQGAHGLATTLGIKPEDANLMHFKGGALDELREVETPAGPVEVLFLEHRSDFETFLQIIGHKSSPEPIARTVGAVTYRGVPDWGKVSDARHSYMVSGGDDWSAEFARLAKEPGAFRSELVVISEGPYSDVAADKTPYENDEWISVSREIRLYHECAHVVCRRTMPRDVLAVWDEITADVVGLLAATQRYDVGLATCFLGVSSDGYSAGRLEEYLDEEQMSQIDELAVEVHAACTHIGDLCVAGAADDPFEFLLRLKREPLIAF